MIVKSKKQTNKKPKRERSGRDSFLVREFPYHENYVSMTRESLAYMSLRHGLMRLLCLEGLTLVVIT